MPTHAGSYIWKILATCATAMAPVIELRGAIPVGVAMGLPTHAAFIAAVIGNMIPVPFIILFIRKIFTWLKGKSPWLRLKVESLEAKARKKGKLLYKYELIGLALLVAIPLPGTGAWTGALIAALFDIRMKTALPCIFAGVVIAGLIICLTVAGVSKVVA